MEGEKTIDGCLKVKYNEEFSWKSLFKETCSKKCHSNLEKRLGILSSCQSGWSSEWSSIDTHYRNKYPDDHFCICGHKINNVYIIENQINGEKVSIGSCCIKRIGQEEIIRDYNYIQASLKKKECILCGERKIRGPRTPIQIQVPDGLEPRLFIQDICYECIRMPTNTHSCIRCKTWGQATMSGYCQKCWSKDWICIDCELPTKKYKEYPKCVKCYFGSTPGPDEKNH